MTVRGAEPPKVIRRLLRGVLSGPRGREVLHELDAAYRVRRSRSCGALAGVWYLVQLLRPDTWRLAWLLRASRVAHDTTVAGPGRRAYGSGVSLDLKLAWRMLVKTPGLTIVSLLGIALGTAVGVGFFVVLSGVFYPVLPLAEGHRLVGLSVWDQGASRPVAPTLREVVGWREQMQSVQQIAAASLVTRELVTDGAPPRMVRAARLTAGGMQVARVAPLLGRTILPEDEAAGAPLVAVVGHELWQSSFGGERSVIGRTIRLGGEQHVVVGVMPPGFRFPHSQELWTVLRPDAAGDQDISGLFVFGRLAPHATRETAQAEIAALASRVAEVRGADTRLRVQVLPYTYPLDDIQPARLWRAAQLQFMVSMLLIAIAVNISILVYARTATRQGEIAVRTALGAGRGRIVGQLCMEALVLSVLGTALGLVLAHTALGQAQALFDRDSTPFWRDWGLQPRSAAFALLLAVVTAVIIGVLPALKATGRRITADLRTPGTGVSARLGRGWTALIVVQVAVAVALLPAAVHFGYHEIRMGAMGSTFPAHEFLTAPIGVVVPAGTGATGAEYRQEAVARSTALLAELEERLESEPAVAAVTFEGRLSGRGSVLEIEGAADGRLLGDLAAGVAVDYLDALNARILAGRGHGPGDIGASGGVVVSEAFARRFFGGETALGRRVRFRAEPQAGQDAGAGEGGPWLEIVGVVEDLYASRFDREFAPPVLYYAIAPGEVPAPNILVRVGRGDADAFAPRLRRIVAATDPSLRIGSVQNLAEVRNNRYSALAVTLLQLVLITTLLLCAAGIHALTSVTVTRRRKEIGIRAALGARPGRLLASIFARALTQLGIGGVVGTLFAAALLAVINVEHQEAAILLGGVLLLVLASGVGAAVGPARRGLRIHPVDALRQD